MAAISSAVVWHSGLSGFDASRVKNLLRDRSGPPRMMSSPLASNLRRLNDTRKLTRGVSSAGTTAVTSRLIRRSSDRGRLHTDSECPLAFVAEAGSFPTSLSIRSDIEGRSEEFR